MNLSAQTLHTELRRISNMQGLNFSRLFLLFFSTLSMFYFFVNHYEVYAIYIFFFSSLAPEAFDVILKNVQINKNKKIFTTLKKTYQYDYKRYLCLSISFWMTNILLVAWQFSSYLHPSGDMIANKLPTFFLIGNVSIYFFSSYYFQFKFHYQLLNNRW